MPFALSDLSITSPAFEHDAPIPTRHTQDAEDTSPALRWSGVPDGTRSFALICHDPDAPLVSDNGTYGFVHWVLYNIPGNVRELPEGTPDYTTGQNNAGTQGYKGPLPPEGHGVHKYYFWLMALDTEQRFSPGLTQWQLLEQIEPHIIGMNRLIGCYER